MPKTNIENAIKKASSKDAEDYQEVTFEGYAPHGIAVIVEATTNNNNRTVANVRMIFSKYGGSLGTSGSVDYMFERRGAFKVKPNDSLDLEELEFELIDFGLEEIKEEDDELVFYSSFEDFGNLQKGLEQKGVEVVNAELVRIPTHYKELTDEQAEETIKLIEKMEEDDDVINVFHNMGD